MADHGRPDVASIRRDIGEHRLHSIRVSFADQHGVLHTKTIPTERWDGVLAEGIAMPASLLAKDTGGRYAVGLWAPSGLAALDALIGAQDMVLRPDPCTWRVLPWVDGTGWVLCDLFDRRGGPIALSTRRLCHQAAATLAALEPAGCRLRVGLELEFHLYDAADGRPIHPGGELLSEHHADLVADRLEPLRSALRAVGLPPRSVEVELGAGQIEMSFADEEATVAADDALVARTTIVQVARRHGMRASFLCRPTADAFPSGWHLHQSIVRGDGSNACVREELPGGNGCGRAEAASGETVLSAVGSHWLAGLLAHADASCMLTTPTINGYKRYRPHAVAPDRVAWSRQHRGAMVRVIGEAGEQATHLENRVGDPAANPHLYVAAQLVCGVDGLRRRLEPPPATLSPYEEAAGPRLPRSLGEAIAAFDASSLYRSVWGDEVVDYLLTVKRSEWNRFQSAVTDWELREYDRLL